MYHSLTLIQDTDALHRDCDAAEQRAEFEGVDVDVIIERYYAQIAKGCFINQHGVSNRALVAELIARKTRRQNTRQFLAASAVGVFAAGLLILAQFTAVEVAGAATTHTLQLLGL